MRAIAAIFLSLCAIEGIACWWMHPASAGLGEPVLTYQPVGQDHRIGPLLANGVESEIRGQGAANATVQSPPSKFDVRCSKFDDPSTSLPNPKSKINNHQSEISSTDHCSPITDHSSTSSFQLSDPSVSAFQLLPELVSRSIPSLRCTTGTAARIDREDGITIHVAFFEWDLAASNNVLEAFKHLPEECMGSIGMTLVKTHPPRKYVVGKSVGLDRRAGLLVANGVESQGAEIGDRGSEIVDESPSTSLPNQKSKINNQQSSISSPHLQSPISNPPLLFDHTVFRDPSGKPIHAFKGVWVSGATDLLGPGDRGGVEQWNQIRWKAALKRFRPAHARVVQGAVRGIANPDLAWQAFEETMLADLTFER